MTIKTMDDAQARAEARGPFRLAAFALPAAPLLALSVPTLVFLPPYYNHHLGVDLATISLIFLAARMFDIVANPIIGGLQDRSRTQFGRRRFWLAAMTPALMAAVWLAFVGLPPGVSPVLVGLAVMVLYSTFASMMIAHLGWAGEVRGDYDGRTQVLGAVQAASVIGQIAVMTAPAAVEALGLGGLAEGVHAMGYAIIFLLPVAVAACVLATPERDAAIRPAPEQSAAKGSTLRVLAGNAALRAILAPDFLIGMSQGVTGALFLFYVQHGLGFHSSAAILLLAYFAAGLVGVPAWVWLGKRLGKHRALQVSCLWSAVTLAVLPAIPKGDFAIALAGISIAGLASAAPTMLVRAMMGDVVDADELASGKRRSGLFFGLMLTTTKIGLALGPLTYAVLALFGFDAKLGAANSPDAMNALMLLFAAGPALLNLVAIATLRSYPFDARRQAEIKAALAARAGAA
jgi:Na+/melibiose symporter-like transporter